MFRWTLSENVLNDDADFVSIYVNSIKTDGVSSVTPGATITINAYVYDLDTDDTIKVHYVKSY